jgi:hypothetical protein
MTEQDRAHRARISEEVSIIKSSLLPEDYTQLVAQAKANLVIKKITQP